MEGTIGKMKGPSEKLEDFLLSLYQRHLELDHVEKDDNFFVLGGDSIRATQIANQIQNQFPSLPMDIVTIFEHPTVAELHEFFIKNLDQKELANFGQPLQQE